MGLVRSLPQEGLSCLRQKVIQGESALFSADLLTIAVQHDLPDLLLVMFIGEVIPVDAGDILGNLGQADAFMKSHRVLVILGPGEGNLRTEPGNGAVEPRTDDGGAFHLFNSAKEGLPGWLRFRFLGKPRLIPYPCGTQARDQHRSPLPSGCDDGRTSRVKGVVHAPVRRQVVKKDPEEGIPPRDVEVRLKSENTENSDLSQFVGFAQDREPCRMRVEPSGAFATDNRKENHQPWRHFDTPEGFGNG